MKRTFIILLLSITSIFILSACAAKQSVTPVSSVELQNPIIPDTPISEISCSVISAQPTLASSVNSYYPPANETDLTVGRADAPVTIIEYCDFQSQGCRNMAITFGELIRNRNDIRLIFRPLPLIGVMDKSEKAILAALAADEQGGFWAIHDLLFSKYTEWVSLSPDSFNAWIVREAVAAGLDGDKLTEAMSAARTTTRMMSMYDAAKKLSIPAVPLVLINGEPLYVLDYQTVSDTVGLIALGKKQFTHCPPFDIYTAKQYIATIHTEKGDIVIQLFPDKAPLAVNSFVFLARQGWFDGVTFFRMIPGFITQTGDPSGTGHGNPGYFFNNEISDLKFDKPGMVGMANLAPNTNGSQFFITFAPAPQLNGNYTIFGQVLSGLDVAEKLTPRDPEKSVVFTPGDKILTVDIEEK